MCCPARAVAVLDIPLLFEAKLDVRCDAAVVVSAPDFLQRARVLARTGMTQEKFDGILARQIPDATKRRRADFVVPSGCGKAETLRHLSRIVKLIKQAPATHWPPDAYAERNVDRRSTYARAVLDTETTGLDPLNGDRIVEIGCVEIFNHIATGQTYHQYINLERAMPTGAFAVHGLSEEFLSGYPVFADVVDGFLDFIGDDQLVIHNAKFDMGFINAELRRLGTPGFCR